MTSHATSQRFCTIAALSAIAMLSACSSPESAPRRAASAPAGRRDPAMIMGVASTTFNLTARVGRISTPDGASLLAWGYALDPGEMQYPGPTLIVNQGEQIVINLANQLSQPVSIVLPGQRVTAQGGAPGKIAREAPPGGSVSYTFRATHAGTYLYHSGTNPELQVEMGLVGALIVRPFAGPMHAYNHAATRFDREYLFLLTEMDPLIHNQVEAGELAAVDFTKRFPIYWFINGRCAPDTMVEDGAEWLPHQPYGAMPRMHPGERLLMRVIGAGRDLHPFHHHGNHARVIAVDGRLLESQAGAGPDLAHEVFTIQSAPGETVDAIFEWTGKGLGWDIYGSLAENPHTCSDGNGDGFDDTTHEYCADHGKPFPVKLPQQLNLTFGGHWSGSPYLGTMGLLPPGEGGLNPTAGYPFMWHSHTEKEMTNGDIFPGGMMTMLFVEAPGVTITGSHQH